MDRNESFLAAIREHQGILIKISSVYTNNPEDKNDLVQEMTYQLWKSFDSFRQLSSLSTWMYRICLNVAIQHLKISQRRIPTVPLEDRLILCPVEDASEVERKWLIFRDLINDLNLLDKAIILLYLEEKSYEEISDIVGLSYSNVGTKISRIKEKLKTKAVKKI